jgi:hypothetical protein
VRRLAAKALAFQRIPGLTIGPAAEADERFRTILSEIAGGPGLSWSLIRMGLHETGENRTKGCRSPDEGFEPCLPFVRTLAVETVVVTKGDRILERRSGDPYG